MERGRDTHTQFVRTLVAKKTKTWTRKKQQIVETNWINFATVLHGGASAKLLKHLWIKLSWNVGATHSLNSFCALLFRLMGGITPSFSFHLFGLHFWWVCWITIWGFQVFFFLLWVGSWLLWICSNGSIEIEMDADSFKQKCEVVPITKLSRSCSGETKVTPRWQSIP